MSIRSSLVLALTCAAFSVGSVEHGLTLTAPSAQAGPLLGSPAASSGSGARAARRPKKKRRGSKATTEAPAEPETEKPDDAGEPAGDSEPASSAPAPVAPTSAPAAPAAAPMSGGGGGGPASPAASESTTPEIAGSAELVDVDALRQEYLQLRDELFKSRARASTLSSQLYTTKISIRFAFTTGRHYGVNKATIRLDGASVYDDAEGAVGADDAIRFEGYVAPGKHLLTFRIETTGKDDDRFTSSQEATVALQAVAGKDLVVVAKAKDGGDIAYEWKKGEKGSYGLGIDVQVKAQKRDAKAAK